MKQAPINTKFRLSIIIVIFILCSIFVNGQTFKQPKLFLVPFGGSSVSFSYFNKPPSPYITKRYGVGAYFGTLIEYKVNPRVSIISGVIVPLESTSYNVTAIVGSITSVKLT